MKVLILGGAKSGKSDLAQKVALRLAGEGPRYYLATMLPMDGEDEARIASHLARRAGMGFKTLEEGYSLLAALEATHGRGVFLVDSLTALYTNLLFPKEKGYSLDPEGSARFREEVLAFCERVRDAVFVGDDVFTDGMRFARETELFREGYGSLLCALAARCDTVVEVRSSLGVCRKGEIPW